MTLKSSEVTIAALADFFELTSVLIVLLLAFVMQFIFNELPCPLCLLQRFGFIAIAFGLLLNFKFGFRPSHYSIVLLSALFTVFVAMRQIALHVMPGTGSYGSPIFGLHLYTWSFIAAMLIVIETSLFLGLDWQYARKDRQTRWWKHATNVLYSFLIFLTITNIFSTLFECGLAECPENPTTYLMSLS